MTKYTPPKKKKKSEQYIKIHIKMLLLTYYIKTYEVYNFYSLQGWIKQYRIHLSSWMVAKIRASLIDCTK